MQLSFHAIAKMNERGISEDEVYEAVTYGARWPSQRNEGYSFARKGNLVVVLEGSRWVITTYKVLADGTTHNPG